MEIADKSSENGNMWVIFIGHGAPSEDGSDGMLIGVDAQQDAQGLYGRSISQEKLLSLLEQGKQKENQASPVGTAAATVMELAVLHEDVPTELMAATFTSYATLPSS